MLLSIQDPIDPNADYLHEAMLGACIKATSGGAIFAYASAHGVKLLLEDDTFQKFAKKREFTLIVGVDAITNLKALEALQNYGKQAAGLRLLAFLHDKPRTTFHPKFCWFESTTGGVLLTGSGNLTVGGLRLNWEAFTTLHLSPGEMKEVKAQWNRWMSARAAMLKALNDPDVIARAKQNVVKVKRDAPPSVRRLAVAEEAEVEEDRPSTPTDDGLQVLIAEIGGGTRWKQANFDIETFKNFFQADPKRQQRVIFYHVAADGSVGDIEQRPSVAVKSQNYRFELEAARGVPYPGGSKRPIGVFVRIATRTIRYRLLMPSDPTYSIVHDFLAKNYKGPTRNLRRVIINARGLREIWPTSPVLNPKESRFT